MNTVEAANAFLHHCVTEKQLSEKTIAAYRQDLAEFSSHFGRVDVSEISGAALVAFVDFLLRQRSLAPATVKRRLACVKSMFQWLLRRSHAIVNPFSTVDIKIRIPARLPRCLQIADMARLAEAAECEGGLTRLVTLLLFSTGMRVGELSALQIDDVNLQAGTIRVFGKGARERLVFVTNDRVRSLLADHIASRRSCSLGRDHLLICNRGFPVTPAVLRSRLRRISSLAGMERKVTPHMLRHTAATSLLEAGVDIRFVQRLLGHTSIATTQIYTHVSDSALRAAVTKADTVERLGLRW